MAIPINPTTGSIWHSGRNVYRYNGVSWDVVNTNLSIGYTDGTGSFSDYSGSMESVANTKVRLAADLTSSAVSFDTTFSSGSNIAEVVTGSVLKMACTSGSSGLELRVESKYNNILKHYKVNIE